MDNKEIPPYDLDMPFNDDNGGNNNNNDINIVPIESEDLLGLDISENSDVNIGNMDNMANIENTDNMNNVDNFSNFDNFNDVGNVDNAEQFREVKNPEDIPDIPDVNYAETPNMQAQPAPKEKKKDGSPVLLILIVFILLIVLVAVLAVVYADNLNLPFLSKKETINKTDSISTMNLSDDDSNELNKLSSEEGNESADTESVENESSEDTGIEITRAKNNDLTQGSGLNQQNYPSLPGANDSMQNNQLADSHYYSNSNIGRLDPFNPVNASGGELFEIIVPPVDPTPDPETQALMSLKITGIMYTPDSPSAIINIAGQDQLVRGGDKFDGFSVEKITKDKVTVKTGANIYTASVGEILNIEQVGINTIPNLNRKFAGPYYKGKDKIIEINMTE